MLYKQGPWCSIYQCHGTQNRTSFCMTSECFNSSKCLQKSRPCFWTGGGLGVSRPLYQILVRQVESISSLSIPAGTTGPRRFSFLIFVPIDLHYQPTAEDRECYSLGSCDRILNLGFPCDFSGSLGHAIRRHYFAQQTL